MGKASVIVAISLISLLLALISCGSDVGNAQLSAGAPEQSVLPLSADLRQALGDLDALPTPQGVDALEFAALKAEFRKLLIERKTVKFMSAAPNSDRSKVTDLTIAADGAGAHFHWSYRNEGDYNQDGIVSISDLTPMGIHFGKDSSALDWATARVADGNENLKIELGDLVSIGANYLNRVTRYSLQYSETPDPGGTWTQVAEVSFESSFIPAGQLRQFDYLLASPDDGYYYRVTPCDVEIAGAPSDAVQWIRPAAWPMFGHDAQHTNRSPYTGSQTGKLKWAFRTTGPGFDITDATVGPDGTIYIGSGTELHALNPDGSIKWHSVACDPSTKPTLAANGMIYVGSKRSMLYAINPDGSLKWTCDIDSAARGAPAIAADGTVYAQTENNQLYAINLDGSVKWNLNRGDSEGSTPAIATDGTVYAVNFYIGLSAINPDGSLKWTYTLNRIQSSPAIGVDGTVYVICLDGKLYAINDDGSLKWTYTMGDLMNSSPAIGADGTVYVGSGDSKLYAINPDGSLKWTYTTGNVVYSSPAIGVDGTVYVSFYDNLYAINPDGSLKWTYATEFPVGSLPALNADGSVYVVIREGYPYVDGKLYAISADGSLEWTYSSGGKVAASPAISADGTVYVGSADSNLYAISPDGAVKWAYTTGDSLPGVISSPAVGMDGTVYVGNDNGKFYAINPDGSLKWDYTTTGSVDTSPVIGGDGTLYVAGIDYAGSNGTLYAITPDGILMWTYPVWINWALENSPAIGMDGTIYIASTDAYISAINPDGSLKWTYAAGNGVSSSPAIGADGTIYAGMYGELDAINPDGTLKWACTIEGECRECPAIGVDGTVYIGGGIDHSGPDYGYVDGKLYAINPDGSLKWTYTTEDGVRSSPAIGADGTVYVGCDDGKLYAFGD